MKKAEGLIAAGPDDPRVQRLVTMGLGLLKQPSGRVGLSSIPKANELVTDLQGCPHAFVIGCIMDVRGDSERAWNVPLRIEERLGSFEFEFLRDQAPSSIVTAFNQTPKLHQDPNKMAGRFSKAIERIDRVYCGKADSIWMGRPSSASVVRRFLEFEGAGPKVANMAANILAREFHIPMEDMASIDLSVDRHVKRVLTRLGIVNPDAKHDVIVARARELYGEYPGVFDRPLFDVGTGWCWKQRPDCEACPMNPLCLKVGVAGRQE